MLRENSKLLQPLLVQSLRFLRFASPESADYGKLRNAMLKQHLKKSQSCQDKRKPDKSGSTSRCAIMEWKPTPLNERILEDAAPSLYRRHQYKTHPS